jgi:hypothetical protein
LNHPSPKPAKTFATKSANCGLVQCNKQCASVAILQSITSWVMASTDGGAAGISVEHLDLQAQRIDEACRRSV